VAPKRRTWGYWTRAKLEILDKYLRAFARASKGASERIYLDAFAGEGRGIDRLTGEEFQGLARIALEVEDPPFTKLRYFELPPHAAGLERRLHEEYPDRDVVVYPGDCNEAITEVLADLKDFKWAPTFAFLDPDGMELAWSTLEVLADHKKGYRPKGSDKLEYKVEMWMVFQSSGLIRTLALDPEKLRDADAHRATRLFGTGGWRAMYEGRREEDIDGATARAGYVNLMRWRLEQALGYEWTHPLEIKNLKGIPICHMILATDNPAGTNIMGDLYTEAARRIPKMREEALAEQSTFRQERLFEMELEVEAYTYDPPWDPTRM
jgi:three-Cys-motif partner protein